LARCKGLPVTLPYSGERFAAPANVDETVTILDAKWKRLDLGELNSGVSSGDAWQMNVYASRYCCKRLALVYSASLG